MSAFFLVVRLVAIAFVLAIIITSMILSKSVKKNTWESNSRSAGGHPLVAETKYKNILRIKKNNGCLRVETVASADVDRLTLVKNMDDVNEWYDRNITINEFETQIIEQQIRHSWEIISEVDLVFKKVIDPKEICFPITEPIGIMKLHSREATLKFSFDYFVPESVDLQGRILSSFVENSGEIWFEPKDGSNFIIESSVALIEATYPDATGEPILDQPFERRVIKMNNILDGEEETINIRVRNPYWSNPIGDWILDFSLWRLLGYISVVFGLIFWEPIKEVLKNTGTKIYSRLRGA